jgi:hypothetical protein
MEAVCQSFHSQPVDLDSTWVVYSAVMAEVCQSSLPQQEEAVLDQALTWVACLVAANCLPFHLGLIWEACSAAVVASCPVFHLKQEEQAQVWAACWVAASYLVFLLPLEAAVPELALIWVACWEVAKTRALDPFRMVN